MMFICRKRGYVSPKICALCKIPEDRRIAKGKVTIDRGEFKGDTVSPGSCPWFEGQLQTCQTVDTPFRPRVVDMPFKKKYKQEDLDYLDL